MQMVILLYEKALSTSDQGHSCAVKDDSNLCGGTMLTRSPHSTMSSTLTTTNTNSSALDNDQQHALSSFSTSPSCSRMPDLQFGVFQFEPEEQTWIRNHIIRKELQRCIQTLRACHSDEHQSRQQSAPTGGPPPGLLAAGKVRKIWLVEMERRANALIASLPVGQASNADTADTVDEGTVYGVNRGRKRSIENMLI